MTERNGRDRKDGNGLMALVSMINNPRQEPDVFTASGGGADTSDTDADEVHIDASNRYSY